MTLANGICHKSFIMDCLNTFSVFLDSAPVMNVWAQWPLIDLKPFHTGTDANRSPKIAMAYDLSWARHSVWFADSIKYSVNET